MQLELLMTKPLNSASEHDLGRRGTQLLGIAGGAALAVLLVALGTAPTDDAVTERVDTAPAHAVERAPRLAALDTGVDWRAVAGEELEPGASVAAYDRPAVTP
jgi:hypothetical protein